VAGTWKFIYIGLNYTDHAAETGATVPSEVGPGQQRRAVVQA
jgi:2-keto-4-pentenoate hydratase/2-oxohepta-3-ene-1,7-dioic acid hydratase in catechol pathway